MKPDTSQLKFFVMCKSSLAFFETIAAFDLYTVAYDYMHECQKRNPRFEYRVVQGA